MLKHNELAGALAGSAIGLNGCWPKRARSCTEDNWVSVAAKHDGTPSGIFPQTCDVDQHPNGAPPRPVTLATYDVLCRASDLE